MITIQDTDTGYFDYSSQWQAVEGDDYDSHDAHVSNTAGDTVTISFPGRYIQLLGAKKPSYGSYDITLDGQSVFSGNATSQQELYHQSLFMRDNLDNKDHKMVVRNLGQGLDVDAIIIDHAKSVWTTGPVLIVGSLVTFVVLGLILFGIFLWRRRRYRTLPDFDMVDDPLWAADPDQDQDTKSLSEKGSLDIQDTKTIKPTAYYLDLENPPRAYLRGDKPRPAIPHLRTLRLKPEQQVTGLHRSTSDASTSSSVTIKVAESGDQLNPGEKHSQGQDVYAYQPNILAYTARTHDESRSGVGRIDLHKHEQEDRRSLRPLSLSLSSKLANLAKTKSRRLSAQQAIPTSVSNSANNSKTNTKRVSIPVGSPVVFAHPPMPNISELGPNGERLTSPISPNLSPDPFVDDFDARRKSSGLLGLMGSMGNQSARYHTVESGAGATPSSPVLKQKKFDIKDAQLSPSLMPSFAKRISQIRTDRPNALYIPTTPLAPPPARLRSRSVTPDQGARKEPIPKSPSSNTTTSKSDSNSASVPTPAPAVVHTPAQTRDQAPKTPLNKTEREDGRERVPTSATAAPIISVTSAISAPSTTDRPQARQGENGVGSGTRVGGGIGIGGSSSILKSAVSKGKVTREEVECATGIVLTPYLEEDYR